MSKLFTEMKTKLYTMSEHLISPLYMMKHSYKLPESTNKYSPKHLVKTQSHEANMFLRLCVEAYRHRFGKKAVFG